MYAGWLIFLAMIFDALDGYVARLSKSDSNFGAQLDSLADLVTFGVAPAILLVKMSPAFTHDHREAIWVIAASFAVCAALRLARFNVETDETDDHMHFSGLPSPAAAASVASFAILFKTLVDNPFPYAEKLAHSIQFVLPFYALGVALLMVSRVPYPHLVNQFFRGRRSFNHIVSVVFALIAVMVIRSYSVPIICCVFVLSGPARYVWRELIQPMRRPAP
jgi:CDP-diacylglycerol--serine O-phosphatidyltransferase